MPKILKTFLLVYKKIKKIISENSAAFKLLSFEEEKIKKARENAATASDQQQGGQRGGEGGGDCDMMIVVMMVVVIDDCGENHSEETDQSPNTMTTIYLAFAIYSAAFKI